MTEASLTPDEVGVFARGLYYLATRDPITADEERIIREFLVETKADLRYEQLADGDFDALEAAQTLQATYLRRIFVKAAMVLVHSDGMFSPNERRALGEIADVFGIGNAEYGEIERAAASCSLD